VKRKSSIKEIVDVTFNIGHQRLVKSPFELKKIKTAIEVTNIAVLNVLQRLSDFTHENHIEATVLEVFKRNNVETAYPTIVAGGNNGVILHYTKNNQVLGEGEMVLMDVGCEFECYASDITRTFPKSKYFSPIQKEVYQGVLDVQKKILAEVRVGQTFIKLNEIYRTLMVELLLDLKILKDTVEENLKNEHYKRYVPHSVGHWLGLDVHDATPYFEAEKPISFKPGMVLTIEPGVYLNKDDISVPEKFKGIAIRIEDNILVTSDGCEVLSKSIPKEIDEIEQLLN
jgi:Xaa-Pro aminopeptidase